MLIEERSSRRVFCHETVLALVSLEASLMLFGQRAWKHHIGEREKWELFENEKFIFFSSFMLLAVVATRKCMFITFSFVLCAEMDLMEVAYITLHLACK